MFLFTSAVKSYFSASMTYLKNLIYLFINFAENPLIRFFRYNRLEKIEKSTMSHTLIMILIKFRNSNLTLFELV